MRIALINEGTYPVVTGGVSTWCDQLVTRLDEHDWHVVTLVGEDRTPVWEPRPAVRSTTMVPMWDPPVRRPAVGARARRQRREVDEALELLWSTVLPPTGDAAEVDLGAARAALQALARSGPLTLSHLLTDRGSFEPLLAAWAQHRAGADRVGPEAPELPALSVADAALAAQVCDRTLMVLDTQWPEVDLVNASANGPAALVALARHWRDGVPFVLSEHGLILRERYLALDAAGWPWAVRYVAMAFTRMLCRLAYHEATYIAPVNWFNSRWECKLGADPTKVVPISNGVDPNFFPELDGEPDEPVISFVGRIDPLKDLGTMIDAFAIVRAELPDAKLRLFGPTPASNLEYRVTLDAQIEALGLGTSVTFEGRVSSARPAIEAGQVVALSSISEGMPFTVIEAMMSGRPTVNTDVGGVAEVTGPDGVAAMVVPPRDPAAFAMALINLLRDAPRRAAMGAAARARMLADFSEPVFVHRYRCLYRAAISGRPIDLEGIDEDFTSTAESAVPATALTTVHTAASSAAAADAATTTGNTDDAAASTAPPESPWPERAVPTSPVSPAPQSASEQFTPGAES